MSYSSPTNNPIASLKRDIKSIERRVNTANSPSGTQAAQVVNKLKTMVTNLNQLVQFLTGQQGFAQNNTLWSDDSSKSGALSKWVLVDYDAKYDIAIPFTAPPTGVIEIRMTAWIHLRANAYGDNAYGMKVRAGATFEILDADTGDVVVQAIQANSVQSAIEAWGTNQTLTFGGNYSNSERARNLAPGKSYILRSRRGRYGYAHDGSQNVITMPEKGWWNAAIQNQRFSIIMVAGGQDDFTPTDNDGSNEEETTQ